LRAGTDNGILAGWFNRKIGGKSESAIYYAVTGHSDIADRRRGDRFIYKSRSRATSLPSRKRRALRQLIFSFPSGVTSQGQLA